MDHAQSGAGSSFSPDRFLRVYIAPVGKAAVGTVGHPERDRQIAAASNDGVARERYYSWLLLEYALRQSVGVGTVGAGIRSHEHGGWLSDVCHLSISHSGGYVAVAVSSEPVGVDIELFREDKSTDRLAARWLSEREKKKYDMLADGERAEFFYEKWTEKESIFKREMGRSLLPCSIECELYPTVTRRLTVGDDRLVISVCAEDVTSAAMLILTEEEYKK
ncbi:MAG: 4'-phosphopantetheinyl transferase superfamily protein [Clostridia bacterium]|nr:4'-phosphopantetheinyl transferase superfamily protein [Clostridia bacterium]